MSKKKAKAPVKSRKSDEEKSTPNPKKYRFLKWSISTIAAVIIGMMIMGLWASYKEDVQAPTITAEARYINNDSFLLRLQAPSSNMHTIQSAEATITLAGRVIQEGSGTVLFAEPCEVTSTWNGFAINDISYMDAVKVVCKNLPSGSMTTHAFIIQPAPGQKKEKFEKMGSPSIGYTIVTVNYSWMFNGQMQKASINVPIEHIVIEDFSFNENIKTTP